MRPTPPIIIPRLTRPLASRHATAPAATAVAICTTTVATNAAIHTPATAAAISPTTTATACAGARARATTSRAAQPFAQPALLAACDVHVDWTGRAPDPHATCPIREGLGFDGLELCLLGRPDGHNLGVKAGVGSACELYRGVVVWARTCARAVSYTHLTLPTTPYV